MSTPAENIITWNVPNWVSVVMMAALGFAIVGSVARFVRGKRAVAESDNG